MPYIETFIPCALSVRYVHLNEILLYLRSLFSLIAPPSLTPAIVFLFLVLFLAVCLKQRNINKNNNRNKSYVNIPCLLLLLLLLVLLLRDFLFIFLCMPNTIVSTESSILSISHLKLYATMQVHSCHIQEERRKQLFSHKHFIITEK